MEPRKRPRSTAPIWSLSSASLHAKSRSSGFAQRWQARLDQQGPVASAASDARPDLYDAQASAWQPFYADEEPATEYLAVSTVAEPEANLTRILDALSIPLALRRH